MFQWSWSLTWALEMPLSFVPCGHIVDNTVLGSLDYALENLGCNLIVVMGHQSCGAIGATAAFVDGDMQIPSGFQRTIIEKVAMSTLRAQKEGKRDRSDYERQNVQDTVRQILARMPNLNQRIINGELGVVGTRYLLDESSIEPVVLHGVV